MAVRRVSESKYHGYGSFGQIVLDNSSQTSTNLRLEANNAIMFLPENPFFEAEPVFVFTLIYWRWKFSLLRSNADTLQIFNAPTGKKRLGTVVVEHMGYCTDEIYVNYANQMSRTYAMVAKFNGWSPPEPDEDIPCDEPPSDAEIQLVEDAQWVASNWLPYLRSYPTASHQVMSALGDKVTFYPEKGVEGYLFGGSYQYVHGLVSAQQLANGDDPPLINI